VRSEHYTATFVVIGKVNSVFGDFCQAIWLRQSN